MGLLKKKNEIKTILGQDERQKIKEQLEKDIVEFVEEDLCQDVHLYDTFDELCLDDLDIMNIVIYFEDKYNIDIKFTENDYSTVNTLQEIVDCFMKNL